MRFTLPSGTQCEIDKTVTSPTMGLVIAPDIFGLRKLFDDLVSRLAKDWNMAVCAVDPFPGHTLGAEIEPRFAAVPTLSDQTHLRDLLQAADTLGTPRVGLMGFCMGGMYCFNSAGAERFQKIVSFYGMIKLPEGWRSTTHAEPLDYLHAGHADRVLAIIGGKDPYTPAADVAELKNVGVRTEIYPDAEHGFAHDASRPAHRAQDAMSALTHAQNWLVN